MKELISRARWRTTFYVPDEGQLPAKNSPDESIHNITPLVPMLLQIHNCGSYSAVNEIRKTIYDGFEKMLLGISYIVRSEAK
jgi:hypothetical protein